MVRFRGRVTGRKVDKICVSALATAPAATHSGGTTPVRSTQSTNPWTVRLRGRGTADRKSLTGMGCRWRSRTSSFPSRVNLSLIGTPARSADDQLQCIARGHRQDQDQCGS